MTELTQLLERVDALESERAIRVCMNRYMDLCDHLNPDTPLDELGGLFTKDARWEGKGARYANSFGGHKGREAIVDMLAKYTTLPAHFALNVHYLASEVITVNKDTAFGSWNMIQVSTFSAGGSHLNSARLSVSFQREDKVWRMSHFETENRFSRPVEDWNDSAALPVPK
jgi:hypothetical protein